MHPSWQRLKAAPEIVAQRGCVRAAMQEIVDLLPNTLKIIGIGQGIARPVQRWTMRMEGSIAGCGCTASRSSWGRPASSR